MIKCPVLVMATLTLICLPLAVVLRGSPERSTIADKSTDGGPPSEDKACCCELKAPASAEILSDKSVYHLESSWTRQDEQTITLSQLRGKVQVIAMIFTHCPSSCPRLVDDMKRLESQLRGQSLDDVGFVLVSLDPKRDSPRVLKDYSARMELTGKNWTLLHGHPDGVRELAAVLGVRYRNVGEREISHANVISVLNKEGEMLYQQEGLGVDSTAMMQAITSALATAGDNQSSHVN